MQKWTEEQSAVIKQHMDSLTVEELTRVYNTIYYYAPRSYKSIKDKMYHIRKEQDE